LDEDEESTSVEDSLTVLRKKFVGEIDLPEGAFSVIRSFSVPEGLAPAEEPLLKESRRRFVLFPIQYHEVRRVFYPSVRSPLTSAC
jgi:ribonucleoside-diphosphate reductase subunit M2